MNFAVFSLRTHMYSSMPANAGVRERNKRLNDALGILPKPKRLPKKAKKLMYSRVPRDDGFDLASLAATASQAAASSGALDPTGNSNTAGSEEESPPGVNPRRCRGDNCAGCWDPCCMASYISPHQPEVDPDDAEESKKYNSEEESDGEIIDLTGECTEDEEEYATISQAIAKAIVILNLYRAQKALTNPPLWEHESLEQLEIALLCAEKLAREDEKE